MSVVKVDALSIQDPTLAFCMVFLTCGHPLYQMMGGTSYISKIDLKNPNGTECAEGYLVKRGT